MLESDCNEPVFRIFWEFRDRLEFAFDEFILLSCFVLKGIDGLGKEYQTDFFVFGTDTSDRLKPFSAVYWSGAGFGDETSEDAITTK